MGCVPIYFNNTNLNITNITTTKREKDAVVAVDFKKLKEKGEEKMQAIRERMLELDFKEEFIEKKLIRLWVLQYHFSSSPSIFLITLFTVV